MALADYQRETIQIHAGVCCFDVGALSLCDFAALREKYVVQLLEAIEAYSPALLSEDESQRNYGGIAVIARMSDAIAEAIAIAANEPSATKVARSLPIGIQIRALIEIVKLTIGGEELGGAAPHFLAMLSRLEDVRPEDIN